MNARPIETLEVGEEDVVRNVNLDRCDPLACGPTDSIEILSARLSGLWNEFQQLKHELPQPEKVKAHNSVVEAQSSGTSFPAYIGNLAADLLAKSWAACASCVHGTMSLSLACRAHRYR